ncbi:glycosyltransferase [bacterium]|nr:glycosyltransferase [bacterium]
MLLVWKIILSIGGFFYLLLLNRIVIGLMRLKMTPQQESEATPRVSIIIAARNEAENISDTLNSLLKQNYPHDLMEITIVDDRSEDDTSEIVRKFSEQDKRIKLIKQSEITQGISPKKQALEKGIAASTGEIILTTDADCKHDPGWIRALVTTMTPEVGMVVGQARFVANNKNRIPFWQKLQFLDFQSLGYASAGLVAAGMPFHCTGASLAYRKQLFDEINGWDGYEKIISGDDELLLAKAANTDWKIAVAALPEAIVETKPVTTLKELWHQRIRWGSKGLYYRTSRKVILAGVFLFLLLLVISPIIAYLASDWRYFLIWVAMRLLVDWQALSLGSSLFCEKYSLSEFFILEFIYPLVTVMFVIGGHFSSFEWKGQQFQSKGKA